MADQRCDRATPREVELSEEPRRPVEDPTLGIPVDLPPARGAYAHRLVTIGDSLTHGFMSGAVYRTDLSWPAIVAYEMGLTAEEFTFPTYEWPDGPGGIPLDLERLVRRFEERYGPRLDIWEVVGAGLWLRRYMDGVEDFWEGRRPDSPEPTTGPPFHNMGVYGWDVLDAALLNAKVVAARIGTPRDDPLMQVVQDDNDRAALFVLERARSGRLPRTVLEAAAAMGRRRQGIETLVVSLGSNNALGAVVELQPCWTPDDYLERTPEQRLADKGPWTVWRPSHFTADWQLLEAQIRAVRARHVIVTTVPSVTIAPIARGVRGKVSPESRYFPHYTRPWISDSDFQADRDPNFTDEEAHAIDSAIDGYNATIIDSVRRAREDGLDWYLMDMGGLLDRLATKRYVESPWARPTWWRPYELPPELAALDPPPSTRFFRSGPEGRTEGGLFSLDGVHPTTIGYGIMAQEVIRVMQRAGVAFRGRDGTPRAGELRVDFGRLLHADTLVSRPPAAVSPTLGLLGWLDERLDWVRRILPFVRSPF